MKSTKKWNIAILLASLIIPLLTVGANYFMDPLWCFSISNKYNQFQEPFNERIQKTNYFTYRGGKYQGVLIGTSRSTCINQYSFKGISVFNYSCNGLSLAEYKDYINYARKRMGKELRHVFIGLDFTQTMQGGEQRLPLLAMENANSMDPGRIIREVSSPLHRVKSLLSIDTLKYSRRFFNHYPRGCRFYYTRDNVKVYRKFTREELDGILSLYLDYFEKSIYPSYKFDRSYLHELKKIKDENPDVNIVVYITPESAPLMKLFMKHGLSEYYFRWLSDIVSVFGGCYDFMYPHKVTRNYYDYFHDAVHSNPNVGDMIADAIYNKKVRSEQEFGIYIDKNNYESRKRYLEELFRRL